MCGVRQRQQNGEHHHFFLTQFARGSVHDHEHVTKSFRIAFVNVQQRGHNRDFWVTVVDTRGVGVCWVVPELSLYSLKRLHHPLRRVLVGWQPERSAFHRLSTAAQKHVRTCVRLFWPDSQESAISCATLASAGFAETVDSHIQIQISCYNEVANV